MDSGYIWSRRYLVWDLSEFENLPLLATKVVAGSLAQPHSTKQVKLLNDGMADSWVFPLKKRYDEETMTLEGRERSREAQLDSEGPPLAPADLVPGVPPKVDEDIIRLSDLGIQSDTRIAGEMKSPTIDESKVDLGRQQWHATDLGDRKLPIGSFIDIDGVLKKKDKKGRAYPVDPFGSKIIRKPGTSVRSWNTRPPEVEPSIWWKFTPTERR
jgi:hypothetical protein